MPFGMSRLAQQMVGDSDASLETHTGTWTGWAGLWGPARFDDNSTDSEESLVSPSALQGKP